MRYIKMGSQFTFEPSHEKTKLGFRPGLTQTGLCSHRSKLEAAIFRFKQKRDCIIHVAKTKEGTDQLCSNCTADLRLCFHICNIWFAYEAAHLT